MPKVDIFNDAHFCKLVFVYYRSITGKIMPDLTFAETVSLRLRSPENTPRIYSLTMWWKQLILMILISHCS